MEVSSLVILLVQAVAMGMGMAPMDTGLEDPMILPGEGI